MSWIAYALLSAFFASLVAIFGKIGIKGIDSNLAVAIRTVIIVVFAWAIVLIQGNWAEMFKISKYSYTFIVSRVVPIDKLSIALTIILAFVFLAEKPTLGNVLGGTLVTVGVLVTVFIK